MFSAKEERWPCVGLPSFQGAPFILSELSGQDNTALAPAAALHRHKGSF